MGPRAIRHTIWCAPFPSAYLTPIRYLPARETPPWRRPQHTARKGIPKVRCDRAHACEGSRPWESIQAPAKGARRSVHASREEVPGGPSASDWETPSRPNSKFSVSARPSRCLRRADEWMPRIRGSPPRAHPFAALFPIACASKQSVASPITYSKRRANDGKIWIKPRTIRPLFR